MTSYWRKALLNCNNRNDQLAVCSTAAMLSIFPCGNPTALFSNSEIVSLCDTIFTEEGATSSCFPLANVAKSAIVASSKSKTLKYSSNLCTSLKMRNFVSKIRYERICYNDSLCNSITSYGRAVYLCYCSIFYLGKWCFKKLSAISVKKFPKTSKFIGRILIAIWCIIFLGVMCVIFFKDCSETMQNINTDSEYFDDTHRPDRF